MQVKKDEVRKALLEAGEKEFFSKGFMNASVRVIVKAAGTTIGNFYNYFENKEALFAELVNEEYRGFVYLFENHEEIEKPDYLLGIKDAAKWREVLVKLIKDIMPVFSDRFLLLVEHSGGTKFENIRDVIVNMLKDHFIGHMKRFDDNYEDGVLGGILGEQLLNGVVLILKKHRDEEIRKKLLAEYLLFFFMGTMGVLGNGSL